MSPIEQAFARLGSLDALRSATQSNIANGRRSDQGFCYHSDIGVSIQGVAADIAWQNTLNLAERLQVPVQVEFEWRQNEHAAHPGKRASISWAPPQSENEGKLQEIGRESKSLLKNVDSDVKEETKVPSREGRAVKRIMQDERMMSYLRSLPTYAGKSDEEILKELRKGWHAQ